MFKTVQYGFIEDGKLKIVNRQRMAEDLRQFKNCDVEIIIKKKGKRSDKQNRYYWCVVVHEIRLRLIELGHKRRLDPEIVHEYLKQRFNCERLITPHGEAIDLGRTTTELNKGEMNEYIEEIREWAADALDIYIPEPNEQMRMDYD